MIVEQPFGYDIELAAVNHCHRIYGLLTGSEWREKVYLPTKKFLREILESRSAYIDFYYEGTCSCGDKNDRRSKTAQCAHLYAANSLKQIAYIGTVYNADGTDMMRDLIIEYEGMYEGEYDDGPWSRMMRKKPFSTIWLCHCLWLIPSAGPIITPRICRNAVIRVLAAMFPGRSSYPRPKILPINRYMASMIGFCICRWSRQLAASFYPDDRKERDRYRRRASQRSW